MVLGKQHARRSQPPGRHLEDGAAQVFRHFLGQTGDAYALALLHLTAVRLEVAGDDLHEGGLALPVPAQQAHALARFELKVHPVEEQGAAQGHGYVSKGYQRHDEPRMD